MLAKFRSVWGKRGIPEKAFFIADGATAHKIELFDKEKLVFERLPNLVMKKAIAENLAAKSCKVNCHVGYKEINRERK